MIKLPSSLATPCLVVDAAALDDNIALMARQVKETNASLRPHAKTHKSPEIARRQVAAGALGVACATIAEAEGMVAAGIANVLVTSPLATADKVARFR